MLNDFAKEWVAALRSGKYKQGKAFLHTVEDGKDSFCCLGVACSLSDVPGVKDANHVKYDHEKAVLPENVRIKLRLSTMGGATFLTKQNDNTRMTLISMNDSGEFSFDQIADFIESDPEGLFLD